MIALTGQLAAGSQAKADELLQWGIWMTGMVVVIVIAILSFIAVRRWSKARHAASKPADFSLESLEAMRETGQVTDDEFRELRKKLIPFNFDGESAETPGQTDENAPEETPNTPE